MEAGEDVDVVVEAAVGLRAEVGMDEVSHLSSDGLKLKQLNFQANKLSCNRHHK